MNGEQQAFLNRLIDLAEQAGRQYLTTATAFLSPADQAVAAPFLRNRKIPFSLEGGFEQAERKRCLLWADAEQAPAVTDFVAATAIISQPENGLGHRDYLGALLGLGLKRDQLGDILVQPDRAIVFHHPNLTAFFMTQLEQVGSCRVSCEATSAEPVVTQSAPERQRLSVSSLRIDVVLGAIYHQSRSKALELIRRGQVQIDWAECSKPEQQIRAGQMLAVRGSGRAQVVQCDEVNRKGKVVLVVERYY